jgi:hypothetical protein
MNKQLLNDRLQLFASVGVIIGLVMVAVEIRQSSEIARDDTYVAIVEYWGDLARVEIESDISTIFMKSMETPESLTNEELFKLGAWLQSYVQVWQLQLQMDQGATFDINTEISGEAFYLFGNHASRAWYMENKYWMPAEVLEVVDEHIATNSVGDDAAYYDRMRARIRASVAESEADL